VVAIQIDFQRNPFPFKVALKRAPSELAAYQKKIIPLVRKCQDCTPFVMLHDQGPVLENFLRSQLIL
jgi:hypothetical protein